MLKPLPSFLLSLFLLLTLFPHPTRAAAIDGYGEAINQAGRQRMLSQRMLKNHVLEAMDIDVLNAREQKRRDMALFQTQLDNLQAFARDNTELQASLAAVAGQWKAYRQALGKPLQKARALQLLDQSDRLLKAAHQFVLLLERQAGTRSGHWVNVAGRQRMLSQRLTLFHIYRSWGLDNDLLQAEPERNKQEFEQALDDMSKASVNTDAIRQLLRRGRREWKLFKHGLEGKEKTPIIYIVNLAGNKLLETMDRLTRLYAQLDQAAQQGDPN